MDGVLDRTSGRGGFSFIELMTTLAVASILSAVVIPSMGPALGHARVRAAANVVSGDLQYAQALAARHHRPIAFVVNAADFSYTIRDRADTTNVYRIRDLGADGDFTIDSLVANPATTILFPNGVTAGTTNVSVGLREFFRGVRITRAGQIRILRYDPNP